MISICLAELLSCMYAEKCSQKTGLSLKTVPVVSGAPFLLLSDFVLFFTLWHCRQAETGWRDCLGRRWKVNLAASERSIVRSRKMSPSSLFWSLYLFHFLALSFPISQAFSVLYLAKDPHSNLSPVCSLCPRLLNYPSFLTSKLPSAICKLYFNCLMTDFVVFSNTRTVAHSRLSINIFFQIF